MDRFEVECPPHLGLVHRVREPTLGQDVGEVHERAGDARHRDGVPLGSVYGIKPSRAVNDESIPWPAGPIRSDLDRRRRAP